MTSELDRKVAGLAQRLQHFVGAPTAEQKAVCDAVISLLHHEDPSVIKQLVEQGCLHSVLQQTVAKIVAAEQQQVGLAFEPHVARVIGVLCKVQEADAVLSQQQPKQQLQQLLQLVADELSRPEVRDAAGNVLVSVASSAAGANALLSGSCLQVLQQQLENLGQWQGKILRQLADTKKGCYWLGQQLYLLRSLMMLKQDCIGPAIVARVAPSQPEIVAALVADYSYFCGALEIASGGLCHGSDGARALLQSKHLAVIVAAAQLQPSCSQRMRQRQWLTG